jgi:hypothetical protein
MGKACSTDGEEEYIVIRNKNKKTIINVGLHITDGTATTGLHMEATGIETKRRAVAMHYCWDQWTTPREA